MTACANKNEGKALSGKKAVSATLAGVLAVGMVPAAALATEGGETAEDAGIDLLVATNDSAIADGKIVAFEDGEENGATFVANGEKQGLVPTKVQPFGTTDSESQANVLAWYVFEIDNSAAGTQSADYTLDGKALKYKAGAFSGQDYLTKELPAEPGTYAVVVHAAGANDTVVVKEAATFTIETADVSGAQLFEKKSDATDLSDTEFVYDGNMLEWGTDYGIKIGDTNISGLVVNNSAHVYDASGKEVGSPTHAGKYTFVADLSGAYEGKRVSVPFEIKAYDLSAASVVVADKVLPLSGAAPATAADIELDGEALSSYKGISISSDAPVAKGSYNVTLAPSKNYTNDYAEGDVVNSATASYNVVTYAVTPAAMYNGASFNGTTLNVDFSATPTNAFDASKVKVSYTDKKTNETIETDAYTLRVVNTDTQEIGGVEMLVEQGNYSVTAVLDSKALGYDYAGESSPMTVTVKKGTIEVTDIAFAYEGKIVTGISEKYLPDVDYLEGLTVSVKTANGVVSSSDYTVEATKLVDGKDVAVDAITDAGTYKVTVKAPGYVNASGKPAEDSITISIAQRNLSEVSIRVKDAFVYEETSNNVTTTKRVLPYTGEKIVPVYEWRVVDATVSDEDAVWYTISADDYTAIYSLEGKEADLVDAGNYKATIKAAKDSNNYAGQNQFDVVVSDAKVFADVPNNEWYSQFIYEATELEYMKGYAGTKLFGPENTITRADVAIVLYNMAGGDVYKNGIEEDVTDYQGYISDFTDVDKNAYYMAAVSWAQKVGIVTGYTDGSGKFGPADKVTREQFATMLARYAALVGDDTSVDVAAEIGKYSDGDKVSDWAEEAVAWLSAKGVMGGYEGTDIVDPAGFVTRAQVAKMAVAYQPEAIDTIVDPTIA